MTTHRFDNPENQFCSGCGLSAEAIEDSVVGPECEGRKTYEAYMAACKATAASVMENIAYLQLLTDHASLRFNLMQMANFGTDEWAMLVQQALGGEPICWGWHGDTGMGQVYAPPFCQPSQAIIDLIEFVNSAHTNAGDFEHERLSR